MQIVIAGISIVVFVISAVALGTADMNGGLKAAIIIPLVFLVVYCLARIQPREESAGLSKK